MNTTEATTSNIATLPASPKPQTSREVIQANVQLLIEQLEAGHSEGLTGYLTAMGRFHNYSLREHSGDCTADGLMRPALQVCMRGTSLDARLSRASEGIRILAPMIGTRKKKDSETTNSSDPAAVNKPRSSRLPGSVCVRCLANRRRRASRS